MLKRLLASVLPVAFVAAFAAPAMADGYYRHGGHGWYGGHGHSHNSFSLSLGFYQPYPAYRPYYYAPYPAYYPVYAPPPVVYAPPPVYAPPVAYTATAPTVSAVPMRDFRDTAGRYCREYQRTAIIGGREQQIYGTACQMPDGSWQIVNEQ